MKKKHHTSVNGTLRKEVLDIVDQLYGTFIGLEAIEIVHSLSMEYAFQNCGLHFIFEETVIPFLKKMNENQRLEKVKGLLTDGYIDIGDQRVHMLFLPYLKKQPDSDDKQRYFITAINDDDINTGS